MSARDLDVICMPTEKGNEPSETEIEEEQFGLIPLLQQMSLSELREIARQRGWRVKGASKADYVSALAPLLCDPTETARAVTEMPENLRESLRAAFVADDGSGITATTMAQAVTALRSASGTPSRPGVPEPHPQSRTAPFGPPQSCRPETGRDPARRDETASAGRRSRPERGWGTDPAQNTGHLWGERGPSPAIKPVEAASLLIDLAHWGLVLPWRDSLYGQGRHVLPWHVQRLLPPLAGWCPPVVRAPATPTRARDARQFVNSLYAIWESIAEEQPALRPPVPPRREGAAAERLAERRLQSLLQGWPYEPQELQDWAGNRRRALTAAQSLSVPPPPFLIEDAALPILARLTQGNWEEVEFVCRLLCELGLVSIQNGHLLPQREQMARFLRRSVADQHRDAAQAYLSLLDWSELSLLLRRDPRLVLWRKPYFNIPYDQFRSLLVRLRHLLLRFLACAGEEGWCNLTNIEVALRKLWPHFPAALQGERESWFLQAWGLAWRQEGRAPETAEPSPQSEAESRPLLGEVAIATASSFRPTASACRGGTARVLGGTASRHQFGERIPADWEASQGALLRVMLEGPLYWLGFAELSYTDGQSLAAGDGQLATFRLHGLANWIWDRPTARFDQEGKPPGEAVTIDESAGTISMQPGAVAPQAHTFLGRVARLEEASPERFLYHLHPRAALATFESGTSLSDLLAEWERVMPKAIPSALQETLSQWWTRYGQVRLYDGFGLLEVRDEVTLRELEAGTSLSQHIVARLSPRTVLVPDEAVNGLLREFAAKDYTPKEVD